MAALFKINKIQCAMELQDEEDKRNVFLMGVSDEKNAEPKAVNPHKTITSATKLPHSAFAAKKKEPVIGLDHNCLSHSNTHNNEETVKAFKMACLTYKPSPVQFEKAHYSKT